MDPVVKTRLCRVGTSRGIRIPKLLLEQLDFGEEVEVAVQEDHLVVRPARHRRDGWEARFRDMAERGDDRLLDAGAGTPTQWDQDEWVW